MSKGILHTQNTPANNLCEVYKVSYIRNIQCFSYTDDRSCGEGNEWKKYIIAKKLTHLNYYVTKIL